jgi:hypothetical protein
VGREVEVRAASVSDSPTDDECAEKQTSFYIHHEFTANVYNSTHTTDVTYEVVM